MFSELIEIKSVHVSKNKATAYVKSIAKSLNIPVPQNKNDFSHDIIISMGNKSFRFNFQKAVEETQSCGIPKNLQFLFDSKDTYLVPVPETGISAMPAGLKAKISGTVGSFRKEINAPGSIESPEKSLAEDILYFRKAICDTTLATDIKDFTRFYRSYLQSCISLVDCFLFRYTSVIKDKIVNLEEYTNTAILGSTAGIEKRIEAWMQTFACHKLQSYKTTVGWCHFQRLRQQRNLFIHPVEPVVGYSVRDMVEYLNYCNRGVGGLLAKFREYSGCNPKIGFIQQVLTAPKICLKR